eukprot:UN11205
MLKQQTQTNKGLVAKVETLIAELDQELVHEQPHEHDHHDHHDDHHHHKGEKEEDEDVCAHDVDIKSFRIEQKGRYVDIDKLDNWLAELLWNDQYQIILPETNANDDND